MRRREGGGEGKGEEKEMGRRRKEGREGKVGNDGSKLFLVSRRECICFDVWLIKGLVKDRILILQNDNSIFIQSEYEIHFYK